MNKPGTDDSAQRPDPLQPLRDHAEIIGELRALGAETPRGRRIKRVGPWVFSVVIHLALIAVGFLIPWTTRLLLDRDSTPRVIIAEFDDLAPATTLSMTAAEMGTLDEIRFEDRRAGDELALPSDLLESTPEQSIGILTSEDSDVLRAFAPHGSGDEVSFGGLRGTDAHNIVYVVDASGSMLTYLPIVIDELIRSLDQLAETQNFAVIFFQRNEALMVPPPGKEVILSGRRRRKGELKLMPATDRNKLHVFDFIDLDNNYIRAAGKSNPLAAIRMALDEVTPTPDVIFILSTDITGVGEFEVDQSELLDMIRALNTSKRGMLKSVIKTIQFVYEDPLGTLLKIAQSNGGPDGYKFLSRAELGLDQ